MINSAPKKDSGRKLFYGLFVFPLIIAVGMAVLLCSVVLLTRESETPESLITAIKTGSPSKRWQKAFELSNELNRPQAMLRSSGVMNEVIHILNDRTEYDPKTRAYMAVALSRLDLPEVGEALRRALAEESEPEVQIHLIWALGMRKDRAAVPSIAAFLDAKDEDLRKMAAYALGAVGDREATDRLKPLLDDSAQDIRWNAALALARLGDEAGYPELVKMLDRASLSTYYQLPEDKIEDIMMNAIRGLALLKKPEALPMLAEISNHDKSLRVRQAAIETLEHLK